MFDLNNLTRKFLMGESKAVAGVASYIKSQTDSRRMEMAKQNLREIKRHVRKLEEKITLLEEHINVLEEGNDKK